MTRYTSLFNAITRLEKDHHQPTLVSSPKIFPFNTIYPSQLDIMIKVNPEESFCLTSHTGWGKTPVFLAMIRNIAALVIEPRKFLQVQCSKGYYNDMVLFGRSGYLCPLAIPSWDGSKTAAMAPCLAKDGCDGTTYHDTCPDANSTCLNEPCDIFVHGNTFHKYPCEHCKYNEAMTAARREISSGKCLICNFGNFWPFVKFAKVFSPLLSPSS